VNSELESSPETINTDPHGAGWLVMIEVSDLSQVDSLLDSAAYERIIAEE